MSTTTNVTRLVAPVNGSWPGAAVPPEESRHRGDTSGDPLGDLLRQVAGGDERAFGRLYELAAPKLVALALAMTRRRELAEEISQESLVRAWKSAHRFDPAKGCAMAWLVTIARNRSLTAMSRVSRDPTDGEAPDWEDVADATPDPLGQAMVSSDARALARCLQSLEPNQRHSIVLTYFKGLTHRELAVRLHKPLGTVKSWVRRGLLQLRGCLENDAPAA